MDIHITELAGPLTCVRLEGRLDAPGADLIGTRFTASVVAAGRHAVVDMSGVGFLASMGIRLLISSARGLKAKGSRMVLFGAQEMVAEILSQAGVDQIIDVAGTEAEAIELLAS